jgi:hypothetical protein
MLDGYKTYLTSFVTIAGALFALWSGQVDLSTATEFIVTAVLAVTIRRGIKTGA